MKIITWNCCMKLNSKINELKEFDADIYVIPECEDPSSYPSKEYDDFASNYFWIGETKFKGLGIFAKDNVKLELLDLDDDGLRYFIPVNVNDKFNLLAVWTNPNTESKNTSRYPDEILKYYELHKDSELFDRDLIICGDFNCDVRLKGSHAKKVNLVVEKFNERGLVDTYHYLNNEKQGEESEATFFMYRHLDKPFHLDHVFAQPGLINDLKVQDKGKWTELSDHVPIVFEIDY